MTQATSHIQQTVAVPNQKSTQDRDWKRETTVYQIYPKSFYDASGDGVGDIKGITQQLDYLQWLGIGTIWISPFFKSPMVDNGYDIADYYSVDPMFGTNEDLDELIAQARLRGIRILLDAVINHCSDQHIWFQKACSDPTAEERDYFIIRKKDQLTNWRSVFGGSVWSPLPGNPDEYYMHVFAKEQPDLNWENPKLRHEIYRMINHWLDKGVSGFRVDAITYIKKNQEFPDFPADGPDGLCAVNLGSSNQPGISDFLMEMRHETFDRFDCMTVAEASDVEFDQLQSYAGDNGAFSMIFEFSYQDPYVDIRHPQWCHPKAWSVEDYKRQIFTAQNQQQHFDTWSPTHLENHDTPRSLTRLMKNSDVDGLSGDPLIQRKQATMLATMFFFLRGTPFIYQGQELGMTNASLHSIDEFDDIFTKDQYQVALQEGLTASEALASSAFRSRDNARTPMQWTSGKHAGFSSSPDAQPWLPVHSDYSTTNVATEKTDPDSILNWYRSMIALRGDPLYRSALVYGTCDPVLEETRNVIAYDRCDAQDTIRVICNFQNESQTVRLEGKKKISILLSNVKRTTIGIGTGESAGTNPEMGTDTAILTLEPFEALVVRL